MIYGIKIAASKYKPLRDIIAEPESTSAGNVTLHIGKQLVDGGWEQTGCVVLTPEETRSLINVMRGCLYGPSSPPRESGSDGNTEVPQ